VLLYHLVCPVSGIGMLLTLILRHEFEGHHEELFY
jgi:hypothetical protein